MLTVVLLQRPAHAQFVIVSPSNPEVSGTVAVKLGTIPPTVWWTCIKINSSPGCSASALEAVADRGQKIDFAAFLDRVEQAADPHLAVDRNRDVRFQIAVLHEMSKAPRLVHWPVVSGLAIAEELSRWS